MRLINVESFESTKNRVRHEFTYCCDLCGKTLVEKQDRNSKTNFCISCYRKNIDKPINESLYGLNGNYIKNPKEYICVKCNAKFTSSTKASRGVNNYNGLCKSCSFSSKDKKEGCSSSFIGVNYQKPNKGFNGYWLGKMVYKKATIFFCKYMDSDIGSDEDKQILCAINREIFIIEKQLPHKRNFSDDELSRLKLSYIKSGLL